MDGASVLLVQYMYVYNLIDSQFSLFLSFFHPSIILFCLFFFNPSIFFLIASLKLHFPDYLGTSWTWWAWSQHTAENLPLDKIAMDNKIGTLKLGGSSSRKKEGCCSKK